MSRASTKKPKEKMIKVTVRIPQKKLKILLKEHKEKHSPSEILRIMVDKELEKIRWIKEQKRKYGLSPKNLRTMMEKLYHDLPKDFYGEPGISPESKGLREE